MRRPTANRHPGTASPDSGGAFSLTTRNLESTIRAFAAATVLTACVSATAGPDDLSFEVHEVRIGHPSVDVLTYDHDGDGVLDVVVSGGGRVVVLEGDGEGRFEVAASVEAGQYPVDLALGDLDEDGHADVAVANHEATHVTLLFGGPDGLASGRSERLPVGVAPHAHAVALADLDEDGHLDLLVDDRDGERLQLFAGRGDGSFVRGEPVAVGGDPYRGMTVVDVDGDGHLDVVTPNPRSVAVQWGDGRGGFTAGPVLDARDVPPFSAAVADFDGDGIADIAAGSGEGQGAVVFWLGSGDRAFVRHPGSPFEIARGPTALNTADVDGDGIGDLLVTSYVGGEVAVLRGGDEIDVVRIPLEGSPWNVVAADLDGNGRADLAVANDDAPNVSILLGNPAN